jgi:hypothetical protein
MEVTADQAESSSFQVGSILMIHKLQQLVAPQPINLKLRRAVAMVLLVRFTTMRATLEDCWSTTKLNLPGSKLC